jgi:hypothetical protein
VTVATLPRIGLSDDEHAAAVELAREVEQQRSELMLVDQYYEGAQRIRNLGIAVPPNLAGLHTVVNWPRLTVDAVEERLDVEGFRYPDSPDADKDLWGIWQGNNLDEESQFAHLDTLIYGRSYVSVGSADEPDQPPLVTVETPRNMAVEFDPRARRVTAALRLFDADRYGISRSAVLMYPNVTITLYREGGGGPWQLVDRDEHRLGAVPVVRMTNRERAGDRDGTTEMADVITLTDAAARKLLALEFASEHYGAPQRYALGVGEDAFTDADGNPVSAWETYLGRFLMLERDKAGNVPELGQFPAHDMTPYTTVVNMFAKMVASVAGLPPHYLGFSSDNPASADAIRSSEVRLVKRVERKQRGFSGTWESVLRLALLIRDGAVPERAKQLETLWRNAATPTVAAQTDAAVKLVQAGILPPDSDVTLGMVGLSEGARQRVTMDRKRAEGRQALTAIASRAAQLSNSPAEVTSGQPSAA